MKITLCMIVKNEEKYIKTCLEQAFKFVDSAVVVDTGSTDSTIELLKEFGDKVLIRHFNWNNDFSEARNFSIKDVKSDWIMVLDADEELICDSKKLHDQLNNSSFEGYNILLEDSGEGSKLMSTVYARLFRNRGYQYFRLIHEQINIDVGSLKAIDENICKIIHYGYSKSSIDDKEKIKRNLNILLAEFNKNQEDAFICYHIGATYGAMEEFELSLQYYFKCLDLSKKNGFAGYHFTLFKKLALTYFELKQFVKCKNFIDNILQGNHYERFVDLFYIKGLCLKKMKEYEEAENVFNHCMRVGDNNDFPTVFGRGSFLARLELAGIYTETSNVDLVVKTYVEAVLDPNNKNRQGFYEFKNYLNENKLFEIEAELKKLVVGKHEKN